LKLQMESKTKLKLLAMSLLELVDGFILFLRDVFYVPSLNKNLICISRLDKDGFECHFGHG
jgi:hypothetical protein